MARELEKEEKRVEKKIKDLSKRKERVTQNIMKLEKINNDELKEVSISDEEFYKTDSSEDNCIILDSE